MDKRLILFLKKYIYSGKRGWLKIDTFITLSGLIISVAILTTVLSVFSGYQKLLKDTILGVNNHIYIFSMQNDRLSPEQINKVTDFLSKQKEVKKFSGLIVKEALASANDRVKGVIVRGINPQEESLKKYINTGSDSLDSDSVILGYRLAKMLNVSVGDKIKLIIPQDKMFGLFGIKNRRSHFTVCGLYQSGMYEYDTNFIFLNRLKSDFFKKKDNLTLIEVKLYNRYISDAGYIAHRWSRMLGTEYQINSWIDYNGNLFSLLTLEKWVIFIIISFLILISSFNIVSSVATMIIKEKRNIGILKTIGMSNGLLKKIFLFRTLFTSFVGIIIGEILGLGISFFATRQSFFKLKGDVYFIDKITADYSILNLIIILSVSILIITLASLIPLKKISDLKIVSILRT